MDVNLLTFVSCNSLLLQIGFLCSREAGRLDERRRRDECSLRRGSTRWPNEDTRHVTELRYSAGSTTAMEQRYSRRRLDDGSNVDEIQLVAARRWRRHRSSINGSTLDMTCRRQWRRRQRHTSNRGSKSRHATADDDEDDMRPAATPRCRQQAVDGDDTWTQRRITTNTACGGDAIVLFYIERILLFFGSIYTYYFI